MPSIAVFTPSHKFDHLIELHNSLKLQGPVDFEWVIIPNGPAADLPLPGPIAADPRIRVVRGYNGSDRIGELKAFAVKQCSSPFIAEIDHDDLAIPHTLPRVLEAFGKGADFVWTDSACFKPDLSSWGYHSAHGWQTYPIRVYGLPFTATQGFPVTARSLCEIYYSPDHLRAWRRTVYDKVGGHDPTLVVCDDHQLMVKTYLSGASFVHAGGCGYLYRDHAGNTVKARQKQIIEQNRLNRRKYLRPLVTEWARREQLPTVNLAGLGGWRPDQPLPAMVPNSIGVIVADSVLQFVPGPLQVRFFNDCYKALVPGGWLLITVPDERGRYGSQDPRHVTRFNPNSFLYYSDDVFRANLPGVACRYDLVECSSFYQDKHFQKFRMRMIRAEMSALKGQRHPGKPLEFTQTAIGELAGLSES